jgi:hypothetical protein
LLHQASRFKQPSAMTPHLVVEGSLPGQDTSSPAV